MSSSLLVPPKPPALQSRRRDLLPICFPKNLDVVRFDWNGKRWRNIAITLIEVVLR
jgi:hypothetical protein